MGEITLSIPDELLVALKVTPEQCGVELRLAAAVKLYELGRLSSGAAAKLAGIPRVVFLSKLADCCPGFGRAYHRAARGRARTRGGSGPGGEPA